MEKNVYNPTTLDKSPSVTKDPTYIILGNNGSYFIEQVLLELGWKRSADKTSDNFKLKWVENKTAVNYDTFREGEQMVNRIPNCYLLTNKLGLLTSLQRYEHVWTMLNLSRIIKLNISDFFPETFRLNDNTERRIFFEIFKPNDIWICKPTGLNQGRGIFLVRDVEEFRKSLYEREEQDREQMRPSMDRVIQRYIMNPLLLDGKKFDLRVFMLIASTSPFLVLFHKGYVRRCLQVYSNQADDLTTHLTNQFIQRRDATYEFFKEDTIWSIDKLNSYINKKVAPFKGLETDWVHKTLMNRIKQIVLYCFHSVKHKLKTKLGFFDLYGIDFLIDDNMKVWLIEFNVNPCLSTNCQILREVIPGVIRESLYLAIECFEKSRRGLPLFPLQTLRHFQILFNASHNSANMHLNCPSLKRSWSSVSSILRSFSFKDNQDKDDDKQATDFSRNYAMSIVFDKDEDFAHPSVPVSMFDLNNIENRKLVYHSSQTLATAIPKQLVNLSPMQTPTQGGDRTSNSTKNIQTPIPGNDIAMNFSKDIHTEAVTVKDMVNTRPIISENSVKEKAELKKHLSDDTISDKSSKDQVLSHETSKDKLVSDKFSRDHAKSGRPTSSKDQVISDKSTNDEVRSDKFNKYKARSDKSSENHMISIKSSKDQMILDKPSKDQLMPDRSSKDQTIMDKFQTANKLIKTDMLSEKMKKDQIAPSNEEILTGRIESDKFNRNQNLDMTSSQQESLVHNERKTSTDEMKHLTQSLFNLSSYSSLAALTKSKMNQDNRQQPNSASSAMLKSENHFTATVKPQIVEQMSIKQAKTKTEGKPAMSNSTSATINAFMKPIQLLSVNNSNQEKRSGPLVSIMEQLEKDAAKGRVLEATVKPNGEHKHIDVNLFGKSNTSISDKTKMGLYAKVKDENSSSYSSLVYNKSLIDYNSQSFSVDRSKTMGSKLYPQITLNVSPEYEFKSYIKPSFEPSYSSPKTTSPVTMNTYISHHSPTDTRNVSSKPLKELQQGQRELQYTKFVQPVPYIQTTHSSESSKGVKERQPSRDVLIDKKSWELQGETLFKETAKNAIKEVMYSPLITQNKHGTSYQQRHIAFDRSNLTVHDPKNSLSATRLSDHYWKFASHSPWNSSGSVRFFPNPDVWLSEFHRTTGPTSTSSILHGGSIFSSSRPIVENKLLPSVMQNSLEKDWGQFTVISPK